MSAAVEQYVMTESEAHKVTEDIRHNAKSFTEYRARLMDAVDRAKHGSAHVALGYQSWTAYLSEVLGEEPMRLARDERQDMVRMLSDEGMSTRAIAPIVGVKSDQTVRADLAAAQVRDDHAPEQAPAFVDTTTGEIHDAPEPVVGMDGKTYSRPAPVEPPKPRRSPLPERANTAGWELRKSVERIERIFEDDRLDANKEQVATYLKGHLSNAVEVCQDLIDRLN